MSAFVEHDVVNLNISGIKFKLLHQTVLQYPDSLLAEIVQAKSGNRLENLQLPHGLSFVEDKNELYVSRSPKLFDEVVLQFYITGKLHLSEFVCKDVVKNELQYWKLNATLVCSCFHNGDDDEDDISETTSVHQGANEKSDLNSYNKVKNKLWVICDSPTSSPWGMLFGFLSVLFIFLSIGSLVISTLPDVQGCGNETESISISDVEDYDIGFILGANVDNASTNATDNSSLVSNSSKAGISKTELTKPWAFFSNCTGRRFFEVLDIVCILWFTFELVLRFFVCPNKKTFLRSPLNIIDFAATVPYYVEVVVWIASFESGFDAGSILVLRLARSITVLRILKMARYFEDLRILGETLKAARQELLMLFLFVLVSVLIFSTIVYQLEKDNQGTQFTSIPAACWWGIATLTTVGYGDMTPATTFGKMVGCITCVTGIMIMGFPVSVLVEHFTNAYKKKKVVSVRLALKNDPQFNNLVESNIVSKQKLQKLKHVFKKVVVELKHK